MGHILPTATTADEKSRDAACAVLPVGSFEQHGDYLPLTTDTVIASALSRNLRDRISPAPASAGHYLVFS